MNYKFEIKDMLGIGITLVVTAIVLAFGLQILGDTRDDLDGYYLCGWNSTNGTGGTLIYTGCNADYNATLNGITGVGKLPDKLPIIGTVIVAVVIIGILLRFFKTE